MVAGKILADDPGRVRPVGDLRRKARVILTVCEIRDDGAQNGTDKNILPVV